MTIQDLDCLEAVAENSEIEGGILNFFSTQRNFSNINQRANASAGNGLLSIANTAVALNLATPVQTNL